MGLDDLLDDGTDLLRRMRPFYVRLLESAWSDAESAGLVGAFDLDNPFIQQCIEDAVKTTLTDKIAETSRSQVAEIEAQAAREGWSVTERVARYQEIFTTWSTSRAELVATTMSTACYERGNIAAWKASGEVDRKEWLVAPENACPECEALAGMVVGIDEEFAPGVLHPPAHGRCRCASAPVIREQE